MLFCNNFFVLTTARTNIRINKVIKANNCNSGLKAVKRRVCNPMYRFFTESPAGGKGCTEYYRRWSWSPVPK